MKRRAVAIGTFDGLHRGHAAILGVVKRLARRHRLEPAVIAFAAPPRLYFTPQSGPCLLSDSAEKKSLFRSAGIKAVEILKFDAKLSRLSAREFFQKILLKRLGAKAIVVGYNFGFGRGREGTPETLREFCREAGIELRIVKRVGWRGRHVSSGRIREFLMKGDLKNANRLLGHPYMIEGKVGKGEGRGRTLDFPTANVQTSALKILPGGVFAVRARIDEKSKAFRGMCNIGTRPTFASKSSVSVEAHLFGFRGNLYGRKLKIELIKKLREEKKFASAESLKKQLEKDRRAALYIPLDN